jgi:uncharacterized membrane protein YqjE
MSLPTDRDLRSRSNEASLGQMFASVTRDISQLVRDEIRLAKAELRIDVKYGARAVGLFGGAVFVVLLAVVLLSFAIAYAFDTFLPTWLAFLVTTVLYILVAVVLVLIGRRAVRGVKPPERTIRTSKDTAAFLKNPRQLPPATTASATGAIRSIPVTPPPTSSDDGRT